MTAIEYKKLSECRSIGEYRKMIKNNFYRTSEWVFVFQDGTSRDIGDMLTGTIRILNKNIDNKRDGQVYNISLFHVDNLNKENIFEKVLERYDIKPLGIETEEYKKEFLQKNFEIADVELDDFNNLGCKQQEDLANIYKDLLENEDNFIDKFNAIKIYWESYETVKSFCKNKNSFKVKEYKTLKDIPAEEMGYLYETYNRHK